MNTYNLHRIFVVHCDFFPFDNLEGYQLSIFMASISSVFL